MQICHVNLAKGFRGGERQTELLIRQLALLDVAQTLIVRDGSPLINKLSAVKNLTIKPIKKPFIFHLAATQDSSLLHAHEAKASHYCMLAQKVYGHRYVITRRVPNFPKDNRLTHRTYAKATKIIALSHAIRRNLLQYDEQLQVDIIPSMKSDLPVDEAFANQLKEKYQGKFVVGHIGALVNKHKGQQYLIQAARQLANELPDIRFLLLGSGKDEAWLRELAAGLDNVEFVGFVNNVGDYLSVFDLFVFPSLEEGLGSILLDAMNFTLPIVATNVDGIPDIVHHDENGLLVEPCNAEALVSAITELFNDADKCLQLGQSGKQLAQEYTPEKIASRYYDMYRELVEE